MWCLPTHKRPEKLKRLIDTFGHEDRKERVLLMLWSGDPRLDDYYRMQLPEKWDVYTGDAKLCGEKMNRAFEMFPNDDFYGLITDDIQFITPNILPPMRRLAEQGKFVFPDDGFHQSFMATHPVAPGRMIRTMGFWAHPRFPHNGLDIILYGVAKYLGIAEYQRKFRILVQHPEFNNEVTDETYEDAKPINARAREEWYDFERSELPQLLARVEREYQPSEVV